MVSNISARSSPIASPPIALPVEVELERAPRPSGGAAPRSVPPWTIAKRSWPSARSACALAAGPLGRAADRVLELARGDAGRRHLVEAHRDVAAEVALDLGGELRA